MEIWVASGNKKDLRKQYPFLREFAVVDVKEVANILGYDTSLNLDAHSSFILNSEVKKRLVSLNSSRRFYRILYLVEEVRDGLAQDLLGFSTDSSLKYEAIYIRKNEEFDLICKSY